jgi:hypothetical protein
MSQVWLTLKLAGFDCGLNLRQRGLYHMVANGCQWAYVKSRAEFFRPASSPCEQAQYNDY